MVQEELNADFLKVSLTINLGNTITVLSQFMRGFLIALREIAFVLFCYHLDLVKICMNFFNNESYFRGTRDAENLV